MAMAKDLGRRGGTVCQPGNDDSLIREEYLTTESTEATEEIFLEINLSVFSVVQFLKGVITPPP
jgi:hypothetical protein